MSQQDHPIVGILGGMGPEATVDLMRRVIAATPARDDIDHLHMIVDNNPKVPSRIAALIEGTGESPAPVLMDMARGLERSGAHILAMPCNSAHAYLNDIRGAVDIPALDMISLTVEHLTHRDPRPQTVGLLASTAVLRTNLYANAMAAHRLELVLPGAQDDLMEIIKAVKRAELNDALRQTFHDIIRSLSGADVLVLACTELSVLASELETPVPVVDALDVLSAAIVSFGLNRA